MERCTHIKFRNEKGQGGHQCRRKKGHDGKHIYYTPFDYRVRWTDAEGSYA